MNKLQRSLAVSVSAILDLLLPFLEKGLLRSAAVLHRQAETLKNWERCRKVKPPVNAEFLFYLFMKPQNGDALVGDLEERYKLINKKFGRRRANFWYWTQTVVSLGPIVWAWAKKVVMKPAIALAGWAVARGLVGHNSWMAAVMELVKKVRL